MAETQLGMASLYCLKGQIGNGTASDLARLLHMPEQAAQIRCHDNELMGDIESAISGCTRDSK